MGNVEDDMVSELKPARISTRRRDCPRMAARSTNTLRESNR